MAVRDRLPGKCRGWHSGSPAHMRAHAHTRAYTCSLAATMSGVGPNEISQSSMQVIIHGSSVPTRSLSRALTLCALLLGAAFNLLLLQARPPGEGLAVHSVDHARRHSPLLPVTSFPVSVEPRHFPDLASASGSCQHTSLFRGDQRFSVPFRRIHRLLLATMLPNLYMVLPSWFGSMVARSRR